MPTFRKATAADANALAAIAAATFEFACPPGTTREDIDDFIANVLSVAKFDEYLADPARDLLLAEDGGTSVGYTMLIHGEPSDPAVGKAVFGRPTVELSKFYLVQSQQGTGTAKQLMEATMAVAAERNPTTAWLGVNQQNARAIRFYEKSRFGMVGVKTFTVGSVVHDDFIFERRF
jgi:ribosomal protein S18 acetylase RimI-like enzyme